MPERRAGPGFLPGHQPGQPHPGAGAPGGHQPLRRAAAVTPRVLQPWFAGAAPLCARRGRWTFPALEQAAALAVRFLDDVIQHQRATPCPSRSSGLHGSPARSVWGSWAWPTCWWPIWAWPTPLLRAVGLGREIMARIAAAARSGLRRIGPRAGQLPRLRGQSLGRMNWPAHAQRHGDHRGPDGHPVAFDGLLLGHRALLSPWPTPAGCWSDQDLVEFNPRFLDCLAGPWAWTTRPQNLAAPWPPHGRGRGRRQACRRSWPPCSPRPTKYPRRTTWPCRPPSRPPPTTG